jgi:hypothetical protein
MQRLVITMEGGLIQNIGSTEPIECLVIDYDTEGVCLTVYSGPTVPSWELSESRKIVCRRGSTNNHPPR